MAGNTDIHAQVLLVDDDRGHAETMAEALKKPGHVCTIRHSRAEAEDELRHGAFDVIVTDLVMESPTAGLEVLELAKRLQPDAETIMVTAHGDIPTAKRALQGGAYDFIEKPIDLVVFRNLVQRAAETVVLRHQNSRLKGELDAAFGFEGIIGDSPAMRQVVALIRQVAPSSIPVLVRGESGTGKELVAAAIHKASRRASRRYVTFNAAGQSESLLEDQLFGHVRGAFTGADKDREGVFEFADKGTLFLDEIGDMPLTMQPKLLRVLETGDLVRLGSNEQRKTDVRFVSATNRDLSQMSKDGRFREDLYYRIRGAEIVIPPLRERREDIAYLAQQFMQRYSRKHGVRVQGISSRSLEVLRQHDWPGNVRELQNAMERAVLMARGGIILPEHLPRRILEASGTGLAAPEAPSGRLQEVEDMLILQALREHSYNRTETASALGISRRALIYKLRRLEEAGHAIHS